MDSTGHLCSDICGLILYCRYFGYDATNARLPVLDDGFFYLSTSEVQVICRRQGDHMPRNRMWHDHRSHKP